MAVKGWRIIWIVICLFQPCANQVDIALGMRRVPHNRCAHVQSVPSPPWGCNTIALFSPRRRPLLLFPSPSSPLHQTIFPSWPLKWALPLLTNLPPSGPSCACAASISTPASKERQVRAVEQSTLMSESFWWRPVAISESVSVGAPGPYCFKHCLHADSPPIHQKSVIFSVLCTTFLWRHRTLSICPPQFSLLRLWLSRHLRNSHWTAEV